MLKGLSIFIYFLREMIFDSKEEYDFKSAKFNARKFAVMLMVLLLLLLTGFFFERSWKLAKENISLKLQLSEQCEKNAEQTSSDSANRGKKNAHH